MIEWIKLAIDFVQHMNVYLDGIFLWPSGIS